LFRHISNMGILNQLYLYLDLSDYRDKLTSFRRKPMGVKLRFFIVPASWFGSNPWHVILRERLAENKNRNR
jgi:hypothetical protein